MTTLLLQRSEWKIISDRAILAQLKAQPILKHMIIDAQKNDEELQKKVQLVRDSDKTDYLVKKDGSLYFQNRVCVLADNELKKKLIYEAHNTIFTMHLEGNKMHQNLKQCYWWKEMKKDVTDYVSKCLTCHQLKDEHQVPYGLLNPIPIFQWKCDGIAMDFVTGL